MENIKISNLFNSLFGNQIQEIENAARKILYNVSIDNSEGTQLDNIGTIVNQSRLGYDDTYYRILIKVKIGINVSMGEINRILYLWELITGSSNVKLVELLPAKIKLETTEYLGDTLFNFIKSTIKQALAGGVGLDTIIVKDPTRFGFGPTMGNFGSKWANSY